MEREGEVSHWTEHLERALRRGDPAVAGVVTVFIPFGAGVRHDGMLLGGTYELIGWRLKLLAAETHEGGVTVTDHAGTPALKLTFQVLP
jgi:hypothetical protein